MRFFLMGTMSLTMVFFGCEKDDSEEQKARQKEKLEEYIAENNITTPPTESGLYFLPVEDVDGPVADTISDILIFTYTESLLDGTIVFSTDKEWADNTGIEYGDFYFGPYQQRLDRIGPAGLKE